MHRSALKNAPYNPRTISDEARQKLRRGMTKLGLLAPFTWNEVTGNIVGGHRRTEIIDAIYGTNDYELGVAAVRLTEKEEREANLLLNNPEAGGDWDIDKLLAMLSEQDEALKIDVENAGFDAADVFKLLGENGVLHNEAALEELSKDIRETAERNKLIVESTNTRDIDDFYLVVVFKDPADRDAFTRWLGLDENRYQSGAGIRRSLEKKLGVNDQQA